MGALGERIAERFLARRGARILARNLRLWPGEIDLLVELAGTLVAVEVKTRVGADPVEEMTDLKAERIRRSGLRMTRHPDRYDLVAVRLTPAGAEVRWLPSVC
ncbi:MAG: YraN family protein [Acidimicrobiia bacterium]|nr:YraN family protein [Acidimicrobiia bacterium]